MQGLTLRVLDEQSNSLISSTVANPGPAGIWAFKLPANTIAKSIRIGLENGSANGQGTHIVSLSEVRVIRGANLAAHAPSYMVRLTDSLPPPSNANDDNYATYTETTPATVDAYWEVDLGKTHALHSVRAIAAAGFQQRLTHATVRFFDHDHHSVFSQHLAGVSESFDVNPPQPVLARYIRVGFENKERSHPTGQIEWWLGLREVQAFGTQPQETGLIDFSTALPNILPSASTQLSWRQLHLNQLELYPRSASSPAPFEGEEFGHVTVAPTNSVEYALVGSNLNGTVTRFVTVTVNGRALPPQITEFVANNRLSLRDGRSNAPDWIELHNPNNTELNLAGYSLTDDPASLSKWLFPASTTLPPHGYLLVFASGRNQSFDDAGLLHANFSLNASGESILLVNPNGVPVDIVKNFPPQMEDLAYGRTLSGDWAFLDPTPGRPNTSASYEGWLHPVRFSHSRGFQSSPFTLTITNPNPDSQLFYSTNGTDPALLYSNPFQIQNTVSVRAIARRTRYKSPPTQTQTFLFLDRIIASPVMNTGITRDARYTARLRQGLLDLPTLCLTVPTIPDDWNEGEASVEILWPDGSSSIQSNCGLNRFGGAWTTFNKKNYRLRFRPEYGARKLQAPLFRGFEHGFPAAESFDEIDLHGGGHDMSERGFYMAGRFTEDTMLEMGSLNPHGRFVHVYLNGTYWGQYHARERLVDSFLADYLGGKTEDYVNVRGNDNVSSDFVPGTPDPPNRVPWESLRANRRSYSIAKELLDVPHYIDFMLMWNYGNSESEFRAAGPIAPGSGFKFWLGDADGYLRTSALTLNQTGNSGPGNLFGGLIAEKHPDFMMLLADRIYKHLFNDGALTPNRNLARLNSRMYEITNSLVAECARWNHRTPANWESAAQAIRSNLFPQRTANLFSMLRNRGLYPAVNPPQFNSPGGSVTNGFELTLSSNSGIVYYTLDGSDPRLPGGAIAPTARAEPNSPFTLTLQQPVRVKARVKAGSTWSALAEARFVVEIDPRSLVIQWAISPATGRPQFSFLASPGQTYEAQYSFNLAPANWQLLQRIENSPGGLHIVPDLPQSSQCFLRIVWVPR